jgi:hypothetical protein
MDLPCEESLRWIVSRYAGLLSRHGEGIGAPELVQPTGEYFPDEFAPTGEGVARLLARVLEYAPVREGLDVRLRFVEASGDEAGGCGTGGCGTKSSGACGTEQAATLRDRVIETDDAYLVEMPVEAVAHPVALTTVLARAVGTIVLSEAGEELSAPEVGGMSELMAVACGFGALVTSGAHVYGKSCGGARITQHTHLTVEEAAVALALFAATHELKPATVREHLETTQREAFAEAHDWLTSNPVIVAQLKSRPEVLEAGMFRIEETKGFFGKLMAKRAAMKEEDALWYGAKPASARR